MEEKEKDQFEERMKKRKFYTVIALKTLIVIVGSVLSFSLGINLREKSGIRKTEKLATALVQELDHINEISESLPKREQILEETTTMVELSYTKRKYKDLKLLERAGLNAIEINRVSEIFKTLADINSTIKFFTNNILLGNLYTSRNIKNKFPYFINNVYD